MKSWTTVSLQSLTESCGAAQHNEGGLEEVALDLCDVAASTATQHTPEDLDWRSNSWTMKPQASQHEALGRAVLGLPTQRDVENGCFEWYEDSP
eukprot:1742240-Amphidinium_carterae.3